MHLLSLEIAFGACLLVKAFTRLIPIPISWYWFVLLFNGVLMVYWADHLADSRKPLLVQNSLRHAIFKRYRKPFLAGLTLLIAINASIALWQLSIWQLLAGMGICATLALYLLRHNRFPMALLFEKELWIAGLYAIAISLAPILSLGSLSLQVWPELLIITTLIGIAALQNVFSIALIEAQNDLAQGVRNMATRYPGYLIKDIQLMFMVLMAMLCIMLYLVAPLPNSIYIGVILSLLAALQILLPWYYKVTQDETYRYLGEWLFVLAGFLLYIL